MKNEEDPYTEIDRRQHYQPHYYGDVTRRYMFLAGFVIMAAALLDSELRNLYILLGVFGVAVFTILAGLTSPQKRAVLFIDVMISAIMFPLFEYLAIVAYVQYENFYEPAFFLRQLLAVIFLITLYYSTKTTRFYERGGSK